MSETSNGGAHGRMTVNTALQTIESLSCLPSSRDEGEWPELEAVVPGAWAILCRFRQRRHELDVVRERMAGVERELAGLLELAHELQEALDTHGVITGCITQRDCDMAEWSETFQVSSVVEYLNVRAAAVEGADGPVRVFLIEPDDQAAYDRPVRDRALEAFECGRGMCLDV